MVVNDVLNEKVNFMGDNVVRKVVSCLVSFVYN